MRLLGMRGWVMLSFIHAWVKPTDDCKRQLKASIDAVRRAFTRPRAQHTTTLPAA